MGLRKNGAEPSCPVPGKGAGRVLETENQVMPEGTNLTVFYLCVIPLNRVLCPETSRIRLLYSCNMKQEKSLHSE